MSKVLSIFFLLLFSGCTTYTAVCNTPIGPEILPKQSYFIPSHLKTTVYNNAGDEHAAFIPEAQCIFIKE